MPDDTSIGSSLNVQGLYFGYGPTTIFEDFSLKSSANLILFEGPSGCGKTTLLKLLAGLLSPSKCDSLGHLFPVRLVLQEDALFPWLTVEQNLACAPDWRGFDSCPANLADLVALVRPLARQRACTLSFGQRRVTELLRVIAAPSPLVCLDEPFNFLDPTKRGVVAAAIEGLSQNGTRFVISTHYREDLLLHGDLLRFDGRFPVRALETMR